MDSISSYASICNPERLTHDDFINFLRCFVDTLCRLANFLCRFVDFLRCLANPPRRPGKFLRRFMDIVRHLVDFLRRFVYFLRRFVGFLCRFVDLIRCFVNALCVTFDPLGILVSVLQKRRLSGALSRNPVQGVHTAYLVIRNSII